MKKLLPVFAFVTILISCSKPVVEKPIPVTDASISRSLVFPNRNGEVKAAAYFGKDYVEAKAQLTDGFVYLTLDASPKTNNTSGELIQFKIDQSHLQTGLARTYNFTDPSAKILSCRYLYIKKDNVGDIWASITETQMGVAFEGQLKVTSYDPARKLITGEFQIAVRQLITDPTIKSVGMPIDPLNKCDLTVMGAFQNVVLK